MVKLRTTTGVFFLSVLLLQASHSATATVASAQMPATPVANAEERQRGIELYRQEKFAEAAKLLRKALKKSYSDDEGWHYLGLALLRQPKELKEASKAFEIALKLRPNFAAAHAGLSYSLLRRNKLSDAIREAQAALRIDPNTADAHYVIGVARLRAGAQEDALQQAEAAIKLNPQFAPYGLTEASVRAARKIKFIPATVDGRPVSMFVQLEYHFNLY